MDGRESNRKQLTAYAISRAPASRWWDQKRLTCEVLVLVSHLLAGVIRIERQRAAPEGSQEGGTAEGGGESSRAKGVGAKGPRLFLPS